MVVSHNVPALFTNLSMRRADRGLQLAMQRLSTGMRINSARDDAAGLAIANKLTYQVGGLNRASDNSTHGISMIQTAEGALNEVHNMLQRLRELAVQASTDTLTAENRRIVQLEVDQLIEELNLISTRTEFNRMRILNGEAERILESFTSTGVAPTRSIVTPTFVSNSVQPGTLSYNIYAVGTQAFLQIPSFNTPVGGPPPPGSTLSVNGVSITMGNSWSTFQSDFVRALEVGGMGIQHGATTYIHTHVAGSDQSISIGGSPEMMQALGLTSAVTSSRGTDAIVGITGLTDINGATQPHQAFAVSTRGNAVVVRGTQGEDIRFNIQVSFAAEGTPIRNPADPPAPPVIDAPTTRFIFSNGVMTPLGAGATPPVTPPTGADYGPVLGMDLVIRNFGPVMLQIGPSHNMAMSVQIPRVNSETLGLVEFVDGRMRNLVNYRNREGASAAIDVSNDAINFVSSIRSRLGAYQNRLESTVRSLDVAAENTEISRSRIQDTDMARESTLFAQYNVMLQAAMAILGQANQRPQQLISLLQ